MSIDEFNEDEFKVFLGNPQLRLHLRFGNLNQSMEFRFLNDFFQYDLFFQHKVNSTHQYTGYYANKLYRDWQFIYDLCSGIIHGYKFIVPCNTEDYLKNMYGDKWYVPNEKNYRFHNRDRNFSQPYNESEILTYYKRQYSKSDTKKIFK